MTGRATRRSRGDRGLCGSAPGRDGVIRRIRNRTIRAKGPGPVEIERAGNPILGFAGTMPDGVYPEGYLDELRGEWEW